ncbi:MAG: hypothetical protein QOF24_1597 [Verrucomicrobiota bacterium]|jgi:non-specific serine/threonine protein kinase/serine/threonine-protein kinase
MMEVSRHPIRSVQMTPARWQQVKTILADAIERDDALGRAAFVESSCAGDPLLKREVEALLAYADNPGDTVR